MTDRIEGELREEQVVEKFTEIAFSADTRDGDRLRALDWLADYLRRRKSDGAVMERLDRILDRIKKGE